MTLVNNARGFSLIELITVVIIIGLLAMVGIPRYIKLMNKARDAGVESQASIFSGAVLSARTQWVVNQRSKKRDSQGRYNHVVFDGSSLWLTDKNQGFVNEGYPIVPSKGDYKSVISDQDCADLMGALLQNPPHTLPASDFDPDKEQLTKVRYLAKSEGQVCKYIQQEGNGNYFLYNLEQGDVTVKLER